MKVTIASNYGLCQGVRNAIALAYKAKEEHPNQPIYLLNRLVHNDLIMSSLKEHGIILIDNKSSLKEKIESIDQGVVIFSAHGHDLSLNKLAKDKGLIIYDTTCPFVYNNMKLIKKALDNSHPVIYIGVPSHPEGEAALSLSDEIIFIDHKNVTIPRIYLKEPHVFNQTTLSIYDLEKVHNLIKSSFPDAIFYNDICHATSVRQKALDEVTNEDVILILGDKKSSNSIRLFEIAQEKNPNKKTYICSSLEEVKLLNLTPYKSIFITAGASTPDIFIQEVIDYLSKIK